MYNFNGLSAAPWSIFISIYHGRIQPATFGGWGQNSLKWRYIARGVWGHSITFSIMVFNRIFNSIFNKYFVQMKLDFYLHFILTRFDNTSDNTKLINWQKGHHGCRRWTCLLKERIFISNIDMNAEHKSSFYKFVGGREGSKFGPPNFLLGAWPLWPLSRSPLSTHVFIKICITVNIVICI